MENLVKKLKFLGLTKVEAEVYLALLKLGMSRAGKISKEAQLNRTTTYAALKSLLDKGLISYVIESNRKVFKATNPKYILELIKEKEEEAEKMLPKLLSLYTSPKKESQVTLFYGYKGVKSVFQDILRTAKEVLVIDAEGQFSEKMSYYAPYYIREVERKKIKIRHIVRRGAKVNSTKTTTIKYIPRKTKSQSVIDIYGDKVAIIIWSEPPEAVVIKNKAAADSFRSYFEILWKSAKN
ncbi:MAG: hypothetical protein J7K73_01345 [Nanoarchaeota archaeon]|nr:hypothetical protein [Nanoarchaeota archaeon]